MTHRLTQATINPGGRFDPQSKIYGGIAFSGNTQATTVAAVDTWYRIGTGNAIHSPYSTILPIAYDNKYWTLVGTVTASQYIQYGGLEGSNVIATGPTCTLTVNWGATFQAATASKISLKLVRVPNGESPVDVVTRTTSAPVAGFPVSARFTYITQVNPLDKFYIEFQNNTGIIDVTVASSDIIFTQ